MQLPITPHVCAVAAPHSPAVGALASMGSPSSTAVLIASACCRSSSSSIGSAPSPPVPTAATGLVAPAAAAPASADAPASAPLLGPAAAAACSPPSPPAHRLGFRGLVLVYRGLCGRSCLHVPTRGLSSRKSGSKMGRSMAIISLERCGRRTAGWEGRFGTWSCGGQFILRATVTSARTEKPPATFT